MGNKSNPSDALKEKRSEVQNKIQIRDIIDSAAPKKLNKNF